MAGSPPAAFILDGCVALGHWSDVKTSQKPALPIYDPSDCDVAWAINSRRGVRGGMIRMPGMAPCQPAGRMAGRRAWPGGFPGTWRQGGHHFYRVECIPGYFTAHTGEGTQHKWRAMGWLLGSWLPQADPLLPSLLLSLDQRRLVRGDLGIPRPFFSPAGPPCSAWLYSDPPALLPRPASSPARPRPAAMLVAVPSPPAGGGAGRRTPPLVAGCLFL